MFEPLKSAAVQARSLREVGHRPWPLKTGPWVMGQTWTGLLFAHWPVAHDVLRDHVPRVLALEEWDGYSWLGITPFRLCGLRLRGLPPFPVLSSFHELNCRTYVRRGDRPGIWFFSLDASSRLAVEAARRLYGLPYSYARIRGGDGHFELERSGRGATLTASYHAVGEPAPARLGTLEHFLVERYCLYGRGGDLRAEIHHAPWPLQQAEGEVEQRGVSPVALTGEPLFHFAGRQDVIVWPPERVED